MRESDSQFFICAKEIEVGKRKRNRKPVLTSPWKIGTLVALMLTVTSFGVGYYMVKMYNIELYWLSSDVSKWVVDSYEFFREIYPAAAGVVLLALFTYFVIASAVRRYKYYLNSGQDYRKMISLADSVDDLTNPAQIARLSEYPELQDVLRNYGDQIREISESMEVREEEIRSVDLEVEIDSILGGRGINETLVEGKWWAPVAKKVEAYVEENSGGTEELKRQSEAARHAAGRASLSCGKVIETASGASEDILDIVSSVELLNAASDALGSGGSGDGADAGSASDAITAIENAAATLEERGAAIHELTEESNGLALNMALMAARGDANEKDLAQLAEKVRSSAERFGKLGRELESLARTIADNSRNAKSTAGDTSVAAVSPDACRGIQEISEKIETRSRALQQKMADLGNDIDEINRALNSGPEEAPEDRIRASDGSIVNFGSDAEDSDEKQVEIDESELVIDHGKIWDDSEEVSAEAEEESDDSGDLLISGFQEAMGAMQTDSGQPEEADVTEDEPEVEEVLQSEEEIFMQAEEAPEEAPEEIHEEIHEEIVEETAEEIIEETAEEIVDEVIEEIVEEAQAEEPVDVVDELFESAPAVEENWDDMQAEAAPEAEIAPVDEKPVVEPEIVMEPQAHEPAAVAKDEVVPEVDEEPVYDLFELGAVEYVNETEVNL